MSGTRMRPQFFPNKLQSTFLDFMLLFLYSILSSFYQFLPNAFRGFRVVIQFLVSQSNLFKCLHFKTQREVTRRVIGENRCFLCIRQSLQGIKRQSVSVSASVSASASVSVSVSFSVSASASVSATNFSPLQLEQRLPESLSSSAARFLPHHE